ncbi:4'-phosphopantetheinyl transferase superfamily protein [Streptomyces sp. NBC_01216]|uniref:4'-phosphopantetheinyl transferase family protein n=1 Tax=unclassified Streptomyces TaxID=2593676 RepID=UPI002E152334|nr:4'-phosphopantetheinyl transferase superfamily protein [Streptomyces sp. NBC_01216]
MPDPRGPARYDATSTGRAVHRAALRTEQGPAGVHTSAAAALSKLRPLLGPRGLTLGTAVAGESEAEPAGPFEDAQARAMPAPRRGDFLAGRCAARRALTEADLPAGEILRAGRKPVFPAGSVGSISHDGGLAVALAARAERYAALGCDLELRGLPLAAAHLVLTPEERAWTVSAPDEARAWWRLLQAFCAKEAAYKAFSVLLPEGQAPRTLLGIAVRPIAGGFHAWPGSRPGRLLAVEVRAVAHGAFAWTTVAGRERARWGREQPDPT